MEKVNLREKLGEPGELFIVPRGVEHQPVADDEVHVLLFEPAEMLNTGNVRDERNNPPADLLAPTVMLAFRLVLVGAGIATARRATHRP